MHSLVCLSFVLLSLCGTYALTLDGVLSASEFYTNLGSRQAPYVDPDPAFTLTRVAYTAESGANFLVLGVQATLPASSSLQQALALWIDFSEINGTASGSSNKLAASGGIHYCDAVSFASYDADFEVDFMFAFFEDSSGNLNVTVTKVNEATRKSDVLGSVAQIGFPQLIQGTGAVFTAAAQIFAAYGASGWEMKIPLTELGVSDVGYIRSFAVSMYNDGRMTSSSVPGDFGAAGIYSNVALSASPSGAPYHSDFFPLRVTLTESPTETYSASSSRTPSASASRSDSHSRSASDSHSPSPSASRSASASPSRSDSHSRSASDSHSPSPSASRSASASPSRSDSHSRSASDSHSPSPSASRSASASPSRSASHSRSASDSHSPSPSASRSASASPSRSASHSRSASDSHSPSPSASRSASASPSRSASHSRSASDSHSPSPSASRSASASPSRSDSHSRSASDSHSPSPSSSRSFSATRSDSVSGTRTHTFSPSNSPSPSPSFSRSDSHSFSGSPTASSTGSASTSPSASRSSSSSFSRSVSGTSTSSPSASRTASASKSFTDTASRSDSTTASQSATRTASLTVSHTFSSSPSVSATLTSSFSETATTSASPSPSNSTTASPTASPSPSNSTTASPTASPSPSNSTTASSTASPSPSDSTTASPTASPSPSNSTTASSTASPSPSDSTTASPTASLTASSSPSGSASMSSSTSPSSTPTVTLSASHSVSGSPTVSYSPTRSRSGSHSWTVSPSSSFSGTTTKSPSPSTSSSPTATVSLSQSASVSGTGTGTGTATTTLSSSRSTTTTPSPTWSGTPTVTLSPSVSASTTLSASMTKSHTTSPSRSLSGSGSESFSVSITGSLSHSASRSPSSSPTSTPIPTPTVTSTISPPLIVDYSVFPEDVQRRHENVQVKFRGFGLSPYDDVYVFLQWFSETSEEVLVQGLFPSCAPEYISGPSARPRIVPISLTGGTLYELVATLDISARLPIVPCVALRSDPTNFVLPQRIIQPTVYPLAFDSLVTANNSITVSRANPTEVVSSSERGPTTGFVTGEVIRLDYRAREGSILDDNFDAACIVPSRYRCTTCDTTTYNVTTMFLLNTTVDAGSAIFMVVARDNGTYVPCYKARDSVWSRSALTLSIGPGSPSSFTYVVPVAGNPTVSYPFTIQFRRDKGGTALAAGDAVALIDSGFICTTVTAGSVSAGAISGTVDAKFRFTVSNALEGSYRVCYLSGGFRWVEVYPYTITVGPRTETSTPIPTPTETLTRAVVGTWSTNSLYPRKYQHMTMSISGSGLRGGVSGDKVKFVAIGQTCSAAALYTFTNLTSNGAGGVSFTLPTHDGVSSPSAFPEQNSFRICYLITATSTYRSVNAPKGSSSNLFIVDAPHPASFSPSPTPGFANMVTDVSFLPESPATLSPTKDVAFLTSDSSATACPDGIEGAYSARSTILTSGTSTTFHVPALWNPSPIDLRVCYYLASAGVWSTFPSQVTVGAARPAYFAVTSTLPPSTFGRVVLSFPSAGLTNLDRVKLVKWNAECSQLTALAGTASEVAVTVSGSIATASLSMSTAGAYRVCFRFASLPSYFVALAHVPNSDNHAQYLAAAGVVVPPSLTEYQEYLLNTSLVVLPSTLTPTLTTSVTPPFTVTLEPTRTSTQTSSEPYIASWQMYPERPLRDQRLILVFHGMQLQHSLDSAWMVPWFDRYGNDGRGIPEPSCNASARAGMAGTSYKLTLTAVNTSEWKVPLSHTMTSVQGVVRRALKEGWYFLCYDAYTSTGIHSHLVPNRVPLFRYLETAAVNNEYTPLPTSLDVWDSSGFYVSGPVPLAFIVQPLLRSTGAVARVHQLLAVTFVPDDLSNIVLKASRDKAKIVVAGDYCHDTAGFNAVVPLYTRADSTTSLSFRPSFEGLFQPCYRVANGTWAPIASSFLVHPPIPASFTLKSPRAPATVDRPFVLSFAISNFGIGVAVAGDSVMLVESTTECDQALIPAGGVSHLASVTASSNETELLATFNLAAGESGTYKVCYRLKQGDSTWADVPPYYLNVTEITLTPTPVPTSTVTEVPGVADSWSTDSSSPRINQWLNLTIYGTNLRGYQTRPAATDQVKIIRSTGGTCDSTAAFSTAFHFTNVSATVYAKNTTKQQIVIPFAVPFPSGGTYLVCYLSVAGGGTWQTFSTRLVVAGAQPLFDVVIPSPTYGNVRTYFPFVTQPSATVTLSANDSFALVNADAAPGSAKGCSALSDPTAVLFAGLPESQASGTVVEVPALFPRSTTTVNVHVCYFVARYGVWAQDPTPVAILAAVPQYFTVVYPPAGAVTSSAATILSVPSAGLTSADSLRVIAWNGTCTSTGGAGIATDYALVTRSDGTARVTVRFSSSGAYRVCIRLGADASYLVLGSVPAKVAPTNVSLAKVGVHTSTLSTSALATAYESLVVLEPTATSSISITPSVTLSPMRTRSGSPTLTLSTSPTTTPVPTSTFTESATITPMPTPTFTSTTTPVVSPTPSITATLSLSSSATLTPTSSLTASITETLSTSGTLTPVATATRAPTPSITASLTPSVTPLPTLTFTATASSVVTPTGSSSASHSLSLTVSSTPMPTATPYPTVTLTPTVTLSPKPTETLTRSTTRSPTVSASPIPTATLSSTPTGSSYPSVSSTVTPDPTLTVTVPAGVAALRVLMVNPSNHTVLLLNASPWPQNYNKSNYLLCSGCTCVTLKSLKLLSGTLKPAGKATFSLYAPFSTGWGTEVSTGSDLALFSSSTPSAESLLDYLAWGGPRVFPDFCYAETAATSTIAFPTTAFTPGIGSSTVLQNLSPYNASLASSFVPMSVTFAGTGALNSTTPFITLASSNITTFVVDLQKSFVISLRLRFYFFKGETVLLQASRQSLNVRSTSRTLSQTQSPCLTSLSSFLVPVSPLGDYQEILVNITLKAAQSYYSPGLTASLCMRRSSATSFSPVSAVSFRLSTALSPGSAAVTTPTPTVAIAPGASSSSASSPPELGSGWLAVLIIMPLLALCCCIVFTVVIVVVCMRKRRQVERYKDHEGILVATSLDDDDGTLKSIDHRPGDTKTAPSSISDNNDLYRRYQDDSAALPWSTEEHWSPYSPPRAAMDVSPPSGRLSPAVRVRRELYEDSPSLSALYQQPSLSHSSSPYPPLPPPPPPHAEESPRAYYERINVLPRLKPSKRRHHHHGGQHLPNAPTPSPPQPLRLEYHPAGDSTTALQRRHEREQARRMSVSPGPGPEPIDGAADELYH